MALDYYSPLCPPPGDDLAGPAMSDPADGHCLNQRVTIKVEAAPGTTTVFISGELDLVTMPALAGELELIRRERPGRLVFDLAGTAFADIGSVRLLARAGPDGSPPVLRHPRPGIRRILELTGLDGYCEIQG
ncbi:MAG: STAS domain-containing protein [Streptosporangiaceae bacterium]